MRGALLDWRRIGLNLVSGFAVPGLLSLGVILADEPAPAPLPANQVVATGGLDLAACRQIAFEKQPTLAAARSSLAAANARSEALDHLRLAAVIQRDLPIRRKQSKVGIDVAAATLSQTEWDVKHDVTFTYLTAVFAKEQLAVADQGIADLKQLRELVVEIINDPAGGRKDISQRNVDQIDVELLVAAARREEAVQGVERALSALREAMGVGCDYPLAIADTRLPRISVTVDRDQVVAMALARRGEMVQALGAEQVTCLEVQAQNATFFPSAKTFAIGSDIHSTPIPQGSHDEPYRPGGINIEMPATINGHRSDRVEQARLYHDRAEAIVTKTHGLVTLDGEQAYLRWLEASKRLTPYEQAATKANELNLDLRKRFDPKVAKITVDEMLSAGIQAIQRRLQANHTRYELLLTLAALERVTAGGFNAGLDVPPAK